MKTPNCLSALVAAFARLDGHKSHPIEIKKKGQKIAVRGISQFGEECTKVLEA